MSTRISTRVGYSYARVPYVSIRQYDWNGEPNTLYIWPDQFKQAKDALVDALARLAVLSNQDQSVDRSGYAGFHL